MRETSDVLREIIPPQRVSSARCGLGGTSDVMRETSDVPREIIPLERVSLARLGPGGTSQGIGGGRLVLLQSAWGRP